MIMWLEVKLGLGDILDGNTTAEKAIYSYSCYSYDYMTLNETYMNET